ncbi:MULTISPECIES: monovalent cation/H+ antiporter subunit D [unclassified Paracoccus (in: a-proteobacteria)]|uniref:monovalent cation/H+ antiporter subunit D n=1 Tax=unclassified Paracoccus (in: a-proteobacteria) TaxID=2688777 RepID=UPI0012B34614|nr:MULTISPECIES: monovalent cation/H+ antiporter subunit D [unclassified Paracoccus (in: a-proteobacteria)]UXU76264.1 monovalent cation/H+ antiporter subunit D [Paracoccus sp. SMMA_5]UXU82152.1 monovalent cation/H+ antiporter subunit D [Paracoccus sp. SMMA_5_TC]
MDHVLIAPVLLPAVMGSLIILTLREDLRGQRLLSLTGTALLLLLGGMLLAQAHGGQVHVYRLGNWAAPFGIVLMLDRLAALMVALTALLALVVLIYAIGAGWDRRGRHFHALWQFQLMGVCGAFLTGDAFNLFVFFEVLLIASYGLMIHGGGEMRLRAGVQYIAFNLAGSTLFLAALGVLYAVTGTLNMADMAQRVAEMPAQDTALLRVGAVLLMLMFAIKAALVPLHFWLPSTYANAPGPVTALFAIMTKVGVYGIIRFFTMVFPRDAVIETVVADLLLPAALFTLVIGQFGILGARHLGRMAAFAIIGSVGTLVIAVAQFTPQATAAAIYYLVHSTLAGAALFLVVDLIGQRRGDLWLRPGARLPGALAALFFVSAIAVAGMPPLSGFIGKLLVMQASLQSPAVVWIWTVILVTSLVAIYGFSRAGSLLFWKSDGPATGEPMPPLAVLAVGLLLAGLVALSLLAQPAMRFASQTAAQLHDPDSYLPAVLLQQEGTK